MDMGAAGGKSKECFGQVLIMVCGRFAVDTIIDHGGRIKHSPFSITLIISK